jgi:hypothetical protein
VIRENFVWLRGDWEETCEVLVPKKKTYRKKETDVRVVRF